MDHFSRVYNVRKIIDINGWLDCKDDDVSGVLSNAATKFLKHSIFSKKKSSLSTFSVPSSYQLCALCLLKKWA